MKRQDQLSTMKTSKSLHLYYPGAKGKICLLTSTNGTDWERPELGLINFEGSEANNIVNWPNDCPAIGAI